MDAGYCPLCGNRNECGAVAGEGNCWCAAQPVRPEVLRRLSPETRGVACVCRVCASGQNISAISKGQGPANNSPTN
jgi:hypothetical protein